MSFLVNPYWFAPTCTDADAIAFLTAAGITDPTITSAICTLVTSMKANGTWTKLIAIYPFCGSTASEQKWNLKDPRDLNAAYRLTFSGGWTHSSNGALPNGTNAFADTNVNPFGILSLNSHSFGIYSRTNNTTGTQVYGAFQTTVTYFLHHNLTGGNFISGSATNAISYTASPTTSLMMATRTSNTLVKAFRAGVSLGTNTIAAVSLPNTNFYLGARNNTGTAEFWTNHQLAFAFLGAGLSDAEAATLYTDVQAFQTTLGRQV